MKKGRPGERPEVYLKKKSCCEVPTHSSRSLASLNPPFPAPLDLASLFRLQPHVLESLEPRHLCSPTVHKRAFNTLATAAVQYLLGRGPSFARPPFTATASTPSLNPPAPIHLTEPLEHSSAEFVRGINRCCGQGAEHLRRSDQLARLLNPLLVLVRLLRHVHLPQSAHHFTFGLSTTSGAGGSAFC
jgi:hypothetical protein